MNIISAARLLKMLSVDVYFINRKIVLYYLSILRSVAFRIRCNTLIYMYDLHCWEYGVLHQP